MTQTLDIPNDIAGTTASHCGHPGKIVQGDTVHRFQLIGEKGNSLVLARELYDNHFLAEPFRKAVEEVREQRLQFENEATRLGQIIDQWTDEHKDTINVTETKLADVVCFSTSGKVRFQFIVVPQEGQEGFLESELVKLDSRILDNPEFQIVRLDSLLI